MKRGGTEKGENGIKNGKNASIWIVKSRKLHEK